MLMFAYKNNMTTATLLAGVVVLAACGRTDPLANAAQAPIIQLATVEDGGDTSLPTVMERRHFAIYSTYRVLFDDSAAVFQSSGSGEEEGLRHAMLNLDRDLPACSMQAILLQD